ncbi:MAG: VanW family protein [Candidatus Dormibacteria bacterium]
METESHRPRYRESRQARLARLQGNPELRDLLSAPTRAHRQITLPRPVLALGLTLAGLAVSSGLAWAALVAPYQGRVVPGVSAMGIQLGGLSPAQARTRLEAALVLKAPVVTLSGGGRTWSIPRESVLAPGATQRLAGEALAVGHSGPWPVQAAEAALARLGLRGEVRTALLDPAAMGYVYDRLAEQVDRPRTDAGIDVVRGEIAVTPSADGEYVLREPLARGLERVLDTPGASSLALPSIASAPLVRETDLSQAIARVHDLIDRPVTLKIGDLNVKLTAADLGPMLRMDREVTPAALGSPLALESQATLAPHIDPDSLSRWVDSTIGPQVNQPARDASFADTPTGVQVVPSQDGREADVSQLATSITQMIEDPTSNRSIELPTRVTKAVFTTDMAQALGITAMVGQGVSHFAGSTTERKQNVRVAADHIYGSMIKPGQDFSFNGSVGDISLSTGYLEGLIIKGGRTVPGVGGGVCQVSTTVFRAALNAGLPIVERHAHDYRVGWYEQGGFPPGLDATVFDGIDLRFRNDTDSTLVMLTNYDPAGTLTVSLWAQHPLGRQVTLSDPVISNQKPHPDDQYILDQTLPPGTTRQVDYAHDGLDVAITRTVKQGDTVLFTDTFTSHYAPWRSIFLYNPAQPGQGPNQ